MKTFQFSDLNDLAEKATTVAALDALIFKTARRLSKFDENPYDGGLWNSEKIGEGWFYSLSSDRTWRVDGDGDIRLLGHIGTFPKECIQHVIKGSAA